MLKEVGASGQISLGKRFAGQLFDVVFHADGRVEMLPMRAVPARAPVAAPDVQAPDGWLPPGGYAASNAWTLANRAALDAFVTGGMTEECAKLAVTLIAKKAIPAVSITY